MKADGGVKWINSNIIKHKKELKKKGNMENCGASRGFGFLYIYIYRLFHFSMFNCNLN